MAKGKNQAMMEGAGRVLVKATAEEALGLALDIHGNLVEATPVDTGHARINWIPTTGAPATHEVDGGGTSAPDPTAAFAAAPPGAPLYVTNNVPYIRKLNEGSSPQAPAGFVEKAVREAVDKRKGRRIG